LYDTESVTLTIPTGTSPGTYYILFVADYTNLISETNENNNVAFSQITVVNGLNNEDFSLKENITIYPNPTSETLYYTITNIFEINKIIVHNELGQIIKTINNPTNTINLNELIKGVYFIDFISSDDKRARFTILKN